MTSLALLLSGAVLAGCDGTQKSAAPKASGRGGDAKSESPEVVTSFFPMTALTQAVAGDCAKVSQLLPSGQGPHGYQTTPANLVQLSKARILVLNGLGMETFLDKVIAGADQGQLEVVEASQGITPIPMGLETGQKAEIHSEGAHDHGAHAHESHGHGSENPHVWLDPQLAIQQVATIRKALERVDPSCAEGYQTRASAFSERLEQLDQRLEKSLAPYRGRTFVTQHDVAPYLARRYGLESSYLVAEPQTPPSPGDLRRVDQLVLDGSLSGVLVHPGEPTGALGALAKDRKFNLYTFDHLETATAPVSESPEFFLEVLEANGDALVTSMGSSVASPES